MAQQRKAKLLGVASLAWTVSVCCFACHLRYEEVREISSDTPQGLTIENGATNTLTGSDCTSEGAKVADLSIHGLANCGDQSGIDALENRALRVILDPGVYRIRAVDGAVSYLNGDDCTWSWSLGVGRIADNSVVLMGGLYLGPTEVGSPCEDTVHTWGIDTPSTVSENLNELFYDFSVDEQQTLAVFITDDSCSDNVGSLEAELLTCNSE